jgi:predicted RNase H-like nuclease (RuvC/YqgF family)
MTDEELLLLNNLKLNVQQFFNEFANVENEKRALEKNVLDLKHEIELLKQEKSELSRKNEQLRLATHLLSGVDENREAKQKINKLVREIDKCIALLNK